MQVTENVRDKISSINNEFLVKKEKLHPYIIVVGPLSSPEKFYVACGMVCCETATITGALQLCFEIFFGFKLAYPKSVAHVWIFLQKIFYGSSLPEEKIGVILNNALQFVQTETGHTFK